jgi:hypothetical protein
MILHSYRDEKRRAFKLWTDRLMSIVEPDSGPDGKIVRIGAR